MTKASIDWRFPRLLASPLVLVLVGLAGHGRAAACARGPAAAATANGQSLTALVWSLQGKAERGWATYAPLVGHEIGSACPPGSRGFAQPS